MKNIRLFPARPLRDPRSGTRTLGSGTGHEGGSRGGVRGWKRHRQSRRRSPSSGSGPGTSCPSPRRTSTGQQIDTLSYGQDVPQLLQYTPAMTWYSDSGIGSNYSYFSMRGIQQTRINMTFDGAPLNDPAEHAVYFNNFHDFTKTVDSVQIQRGVGTSSVGSPSYGGSVNFASSPPAQDRGGDLRLALGSYDTKRASLGYESGTLRERILRRRSLLLCRHRWIPGQLRNQAPNRISRRRLARRAIFTEIRLLLR